MVKLLNRAQVTGTYQGTPVDNFSQLSVALTALDIQKTANKTVWDGGELTYTLTVTNADTGNPDDPEDPGLPVFDVIVLDPIDTSIAALVPGSLSVTIDGEPVPEPVYDYQDGLLTVTLGTLGPGIKASVTFRVSAAP